MKSGLTLGLAMLLGVLVTVPAPAGDHGSEQEMKKGILLVAFGTSIPKARASFQNIERKVRNAFPEIPVRWAFTSKIIRAKLARNGEHFDSPESALAKMMEEGFTHVAVQSLHTIAGEEFHNLCRNARAFAGMADGFENLVIGYPLLGTQQDLERVVEGIIRNIPAERKKSEAVVLMGHGTSHPSNVFYTALMFHFQQRDPNIFVGTVEGEPSIDAIKKILLEKKVRKAYLMPFMSVAGDHVLNDMAGNEADSWKSILAAAGIQCVPIMKGTAEYGDIVDIWVDHLGRALARL